MLWIFGTMSRFGICWGLVRRLSTIIRANHEQVIGMSNAIRRLKGRITLFANGVGPMGAPQVTNEDNMCVQYAHFSGRRVILFCHTSSFSSVMPTFSFITMGRGILQTSFYAFPMIAFHVQVMTGVYKVRRADRKIFFCFRGVLLEGSSNFLVKRSIFLLFRDMFIYRSGYECLFKF